MGKGIDRNRGLAAVPTVVAILGLLAACAPAARGPAPLVNGGGAGPAPGPAWSAGPPPATVVVQPGQSLSMIARTYHLSWPALAAANHLSPPYRIEPGQRLVLPAPGGYAGPPPVAAGAGKAEDDRDGTDAAAAEGDCSKTAAAARTGERAAARDPARSAACRRLRDGAAGIAVVRPADPARQPAGRRQTPRDARGGGGAWRFHLAGARTRHRRVRSRPRWDPQ